MTHFWHTNYIHIPTTKKRINISLSPEAEQLLAHATERDNMPEATNVALLLDIALEIEEDKALDVLARSREKTRDICFSY